MTTTMDFAKNATLYVHEKCVVGAVSRVQDCQFNTAQVITSFFAFFAAVVGFSLTRQYTKKFSKPARPFNFMALPAELRVKVYHHLMEDPCYPVPPKRTGWFGRKLSSHPSNLLFVANKQIYKEYMHLMLKQATFQLDVSMQNYNPQLDSDSTTNPPRLWNMAPGTLKRIRKCQVNLITTCAMLDGRNPRENKTGNFALTRQLCAELDSLVSKDTHVSVNVEAVPDPLWNPTWFWYHMSQSLKNARRANGSPMFHRFTFDVDSPSPGQNQMMRDKANNGKWAWYCSSGAGHFIGLDASADQTQARDRAKKGEYELQVLEFTKLILYEVCHTCSFG